MIKIRLEYVDNQNGLKELQKALKTLEKDFTILTYQNRNSSYKRVYLDIEEK